MNPKIAMIAGVAVIILAAAAFVTFNKDNDDDPVTEAVVNVAADSNGILTLSSSNVDELLDKVKDNSDVKTIKINVEGTNDEIVVKASSSIIASLAGSKLPVIIDTDNGGVELPAALVSAIPSDFAISFSKENMSSYPDLFKETYDGYSIVKISVTAGSELSELPSKAVYRLPYEVEDYDSANVYGSTAYFLADDNTVTSVDSDFANQIVYVETSKVAKMLYTVTLKEKVVSSITVKMSNDQNFTISKPATKVVVVSSNESEMCQILGLEKYIVGLCDGAWEDQLNSQMKAIPKIGKYSSVTAEKIALTGAQYVISPYPSMALPAATVAELKSTYGISTIYFDCYGSHLLEDAVNFAKLFGDESADARAKEYVEYYKSIEATIASKATSDKSTMFLANGMGDVSKFYTDSSELVKKITKISGTNALSDMGANQGSKSTVSISAELVYNYDAADNLDILILRSKTGQSLGYAYNLFFSSIKSFYGSDIPNVVTKGGCYELHTDVVSGCRDFIGDILIAEIFGFDTGLDASALFDEFNAKYGFGSDVEKVDGKSYLVKQITA